MSERDKAAAKYREDIRLLSESKVDLFGVCREASFKDGWNAAIEAAAKRFENWREYGDLSKRILELKGTSDAG